MIILPLTALLFIGTALLFIGTVLLIALYGPEGDSNEP